MKKASEVLSKTRREALLKLSEHLGIEFQNIVLLHEALTHTSYANESKDKGVVHNERLEFLGDAVLELATSTYLFERFPERPEGELTKARASIVREATLSRRAAELRLGEYLLLGHGEASMGGGHYLDRGWQTAYDYVLKQLHDELLTIDSGENMKDYKTTLQEVVQKRVDSRIAYELLAETGPDHDKTFEFAVRINDAVYGTGKGRNKKEAEQGAAREALRKMKKL